MARSSSTRHVTSVVLVAIACACGAYAWFGERGKVTDSEKTSRKGDVFPAWRREDVSKVELTFPNATKEHRKLVLERVASGDAGDTTWKMTAPREEIADADAVDKLLGQFEFANVVRKVSGDGAGLDTPRAHGVVSMGRVTYDFAIGAPAPTPEGSAYFRFNDDPHHVIVVSRDFTTELLRGADAFRSRTIVPYLSIDLARFEMTNKLGKIAIERMNDTSFRVSGGGPRVTRDGIDIVWRTLADLRAEYFLSDEEAAAAIAMPTIQITMTPKDGKPPGEILIGDACPNHPEDVVVVRTKPTRVAACVPSGIALGLEIPSDAVIDRHLLAAHQDEIAEVRFEPVAGGQASLDLARKGSGWHERSPQDINLEGDEADAANALMTAIAGGQGKVTQAASFVPQSRVVVITGDHDHEIEERLLIGDTPHDPSEKPRDGAIVKREADGVLLHVDDALARKLQAKATMLRSLRLTPPAFEGRDPILVITQCDGVAQQASHIKGAWKLESPGGFTIDNAHVTSLVDGIERARAIAWVGDADDFHFGFYRACSARLKFEGDAGAREIAIEFGAEGEGGVYARVEGSPMIAVVPKSLRDLVETSLIDGHGFQVDPDLTSKITLSHGTHSISIALADAGTDGDALLADLAQLHADDIAHVGSAKPNEGFSSPSLTVNVDAMTDAAARTRTFMIGAQTKYKNVDVYFARIDGVDATFVLAADKVAPLIAAAVAR
jgi:hypothetical protein